MFLTSHFLGQTVPSPTPFQMTPQVQENFPLLWNCELLTFELALDTKSTKLVARLKLWLGYIITNMVFSCLKFKSTYFWIGKMWPKGIQSKSKGRLEKIKPGRKYKSDTFHYARKQLSLLGNVLIPNCHDIQLSCPAETGVSYGLTWYSLLSSVS